MPAEDGIAATDGRGHGLAGIVIGARPGPGPWPLTHPTRWIRERMEGSCIMASSRWRPTSVTGNARRTNACPAASWPRRSRGGILGATTGRSKSPIQQLFMLLAVDRLHAPTTDESRQPVPEGNAGAVADWHTATTAMTLRRCIPGQSRSTTRRPSGASRKTSGGDVATAHRLCPGPCFTSSDRSVTEAHRGYAGSNSSVKPVELVVGQCFMTNYNYKVWH